MLLQNAADLLQRRGGITNGTTSLQNKAGIIKRKIYYKARYFGILITLIRQIEKLKMRKLDNRKRNIFVRGKYILCY